jgi:hypothetical protein
LLWIDRNYWSRLGVVAALISALSIGADRVSVVGPSWGVIVIAILVCVTLPCGLVTALKGRWGWLALGLMTAGLLWIVGALQPPAPAGLWQRWRSVPTTRHHA